jgi:hypothetical protein
MPNLMAQILYSGFTKEKMLRFTFNLILLLSAIPISRAQIGSLLFKDSIRINSGTVHLDQMNHIYAISSDGSRLISYHGDLRVRREISSPFFSEFMSLDVHDPDKLYLFYPEFSSVQSLDENLETIADDYYPELNAESAFCYFGPNRYAFFANQRVHIRDIRDQSIRSGIELVTSRRKGGPVSQMSSDGISIYLLIPGTGLWIFNESLQEKKHLEDSAILQMDFLEGSLYYLKNNIIYEWKPEGKGIREIYRGTEKILDFALNRDYFVLALPGRIKRFQIYR